MVESIDGKGKKTMEVVGEKMQVGKDTAYDPSLTIRMFRMERPVRGGKYQVWREAMILKDRTAIIDGKTFGDAKSGGPEFENFRPVFDFLLRNVKAGQPQKKTISVPAADLMPEPVTEDPAYKRKLIVLDEIKQTIRGIYRSDSAEDKAKRGDLMEAAFRTRSWKAVETLALPELELGLETVKKTKALIDKAKGGAEKAA
jgi:hypothetical protein